MAIDLGLYHSPLPPFNDTVFHLLMYEDKYNKPFVDECLVFPIISYSHDKCFDTSVFNLFRINSCKWKC